MKKLEMVKKVGAIVVSVGVGAIISNVVKATTPGSVGTIKKVCIAVGVFAISGMVVNRAVRYMDQQIDETVTQIKSMIKNEEI